MSDTDYEHTAGGPGVLGLSDCSFVMVTESGKASPGPPVTDVTAPGALQRGELTCLQCGKRTEPQALPTRQEPSARRRRTCVPKPLESTAQTGTRQALSLSV